MNNETMAKMHALADALNRKCGASLTLVPNGDSEVTAMCVVSENDLRRLCAQCGVGVPHVLAPDNLRAYLVPSGAA